MSDKTDIAHHQTYLVEKPQPLGNQEKEVLQSCLSQKAVLEAGALRQSVADRKAFQWKL